MITSLVGEHIDALDTPALLIDHRVLRENVSYMSGITRDHGIGWRPHSKAHKSPAMAHLLIEAGALGITCAKTSETEVYVANGIRDILIANQVVGPLKTRRLAQLAAFADIKVAVDSLENALEHDRAAEAAGTNPALVVELDSGMNRAGISPGKACLELVKQISQLKHVRFGGVMTWEGHTLTIEDQSEREEAVRASLAPVLQTVADIKAAGIDVPIVSCGGTGTFLTTSGIDGVTEVQAGGGIFGDKFYRDLDVPVQPALSMLVTVTSRPTPERIIFDAGRKSIDPSNLVPELPTVSDVESLAFSAEHGIAHLSTPNVDIRVGDRLRLNLGYSDQVVHLHEQLFLVEKDRIVAVWPTYARGRLQ